MTRPRVEVKISHELLFISMAHEMQIQPVTVHEYCG